MWSEWKCVRNTPSISPTGRPICAKVRTGVEHVRPVGGGDQDHALVCLETVHLDQQLVEGLFAFVVTAAQAGTAMAADRIDFVDEDDAGRVLLALFEHV